MAFPGFALQDNAAWAFFSELWESRPTYDELSPADDFYAYTTYDLMITTALAIEQAGSVASSAWAPAMFEVTAARGTQCFDYAGCLALIRAGDDVDYEGVTGPATFGEGGVNAVAPAVRTFGDDGAVVEEVLVDSEVWLATLAEVAKLCEG